MEILRKWGVAASFVFPLIDAGAVDFEATPVTFVAADCQVSKIGAAFANTGCIPWHIGNGIYAASLNATEMQAARLVITIIDSATKAWEDQAIVVSTYGHATSAQHAFDLDLATQSVTTTSISASAIGASQIATSAIDQSNFSTAAANRVADHVLRRGYGPAASADTGEDTKDGRSLLGAMAKNTNALTAAGGTLTITEEDDDTALFTQTITSDSGADPIIGLDTD